MSRPISKSPADAEKETAANNANAKETTTFFPAISLAPELI
jgi:hypothetical protein